MWNFSFIIQPQRRVRVSCGDRMAGPGRSLRGKGPLATSLCRTGLAIRVVAGLVLPLVVCGCFSAHNLKEISENPYPLIDQEDGLVKFGDNDDDVLIEVRRAATSKPIENLAIHYGSLFPGGEPIRPGDTEEYVDLDGRKAYKVTFKTKFIRKRKRVGDQAEKVKEEGEENWKSVTVSDPETGKPIPVLYGPVIKRERVMYLVPGKTQVYSIFMRADGDAVGPAKKRLEKFVREEIKYE